MTVAYIGIGNNLGDKERFIQRALDALSHMTGINLLRVASLYETAPWGNTDQDWYLNTVAEIDTTFSPRELLSTLLSIENNLGRTREEKWGPRTMDLDLLLYGSKVINNPHLRVPHPRMTERAFVLVPLAELCPDLVLPNGLGVKELAEETSKNQDIKRFPQNQQKP